MRQCLIHRDSLPGREGEAAFHEVYGQGVGVGEHLGEVSAFPEGKGSDVVPGTGGGDGVEVVEGGGAQDFEGEGELVVVCGCVKDGERMGQ